MLIKFHIGITHQIKHIIILSRGRGKKHKLYLLAFLHRKFLDSQQGVHLGISNNKPPHLLLSLRKSWSMYIAKFHPLKFSFCPSLLKIVLKIFFCTNMSPQNFSTLYLLQIFVNFYNAIHLRIYKFKLFTPIRPVYFHQLIKIKHISKIYYIFNFSVDSFVKYGSCRIYKS